ncbi:MAG: hypothetical protein LBU83_12855 [Bacteroidales bacterium]|jgi:hypothetical protein|nr:hypothetical protein [Bacteroidales bacterium]
MKKILLLTLLSVFFLSAYCQNSVGSTEIITKINIIRSAEDDGDIENGWWFLFWKNVATIHTPEGGVFIVCSGWGWKLCLPPIRDHFEDSYCRGISVEALEKTCETVVLESDERALDGEYRGSITKKIALEDKDTPNRVSYILFQMNWNYDPSNIRNGTAEIIISKTSDFGIR